MVREHINKTSNEIETRILEQPTWLLQLEAYAKEHRVPIIDRISLELLLQLIRLHKPKRILEIGTAIGYSALCMHDTCPDAEIITLEKNEDMYALAIDHIRKYRKKDQIRLIKGDALDSIKKLEETNHSFDFVFIDAAKGQYKRFVEAVEPLLTKGSLIVCDNVLFRQYVTMELNEVPKRYRSLVKKIKAFNKFMLANDAYHTNLVPIGDGLLMSIKK